MRKVFYFLFLVMIILSSFSLGYFIDQPQNFESCKSAYDNLKASNLCVGKFEDYVGTDAVLENIEWFDFDWDESNGSYGEAKDVLIGPNSRCFRQGYLQFILSEKHKSLIDCFVNDIEIDNETLEIGCGCFFE